MAQIRLTPLITPDHGYLASSPLQMDQTPQMSLLSTPQSTKSLSETSSITEMELASLITDLSIKPTMSQPEETSPTRTPPIGSTLTIHSSQDTTEVTLPSITIPTTELSITMEQDTTFTILFQTTLSTETVLMHQTAPTTLDQSSTSPLPPQMQQTLLLSTQPSIKLMSETISTMETELAAITAN
jgi:hypothetical protein